MAQNQSIRVIESRKYPIRYCKDSSRKRGYQDDKESKEPDYDEDKDQLEEKQEEETGGQETTNQVF